MINLGEINKLKITRRMKQGFYLMDSNEEFEALLPNKFILDIMNEGDEIEVFVFKDHEERLTATTEIPNIKLNQPAFLEVVDVSDHGAFVDWGFEKHLFVPFKEQNQRMQVGKKYVVHMYIDPISERLVASNRISKFYNNENLDLEEGEEVDLLIFGKTELGVKAIVNNQYLGLLYHNEIFQDIWVGDKLTGYVKKIREDNKLDISLQKDSFHKIDEGAQAIMDYLNIHEGKLYLTDKSAPDAIYRALKMSKKTFKKSIGALYKNRLISLESDHIKLV